MDNTTNSTITDVSLNSTITDFSLDQLAVDLDGLWVIITSILVFWMQCGFAFLAIGAVKPAFVKGTLYSIFENICVAMIVWWLWGYGFAFGARDGHGNGMIGEDNFALRHIPEREAYIKYFFEFTYLLVVLAIMSLSIVGRPQPPSFRIVFFLMSSLIWPIVVHWTWDQDGWLAFQSAIPDSYKLNSETAGYIDIAGSGVIHMVGGFAGLVMSIAMGPRTDKTGRFSYHLSLLGTLILWMGWYGFNAGGTLHFSHGVSGLVGKIMATTTLSAVTSGLATTIIGSKLFPDRDSLRCMLSGIVVGLVSISAGCATVDLWAAVLIGLGGSIFFSGTVKLLKRSNKIDDPLDIFATHGIGGMWGVFSVGVFSGDRNINLALDVSTSAFQTGEQLLVQFIAILALMAWTVITVGFTVLILKFTLGVKSPENAEVELQESDHQELSHEPAEIQFHTQHETPQHV